MIASRLALRLQSRDGLPGERYVDDAVASKRDSGIVLIMNLGEVAEWLMAPVLKTGIPERVSGVRIPPSPPLPLDCLTCLAMILS